jgi:hypothetical protein
MPAIDQCEIIERLNREINAALSEPRMKGSPISPARR